jgi:hypothetical protein
VKHFCDTLNPIARRTVQISECKNVQTTTKSMQIALLRCSNSAGCDAVVIGA